MSSKHNILVTGAAGYIGSILVPMLLDDGHNVTAYDAMLLSTGVTPLLHVATNPRLKIIKGDVTDEEELKAAMTGHDLIIHMAALNGYPVCEKNPARAKRVNIQATAFIAQNLMPKQKLIFTSTGSTFGKVDGHTVTEDTPLRPTSVYGESKRLGEIEVRKAGGVVVRLSTLYGVSPRLRTDLVVNFFACLGYQSKELGIFEKNFMRHFIHVRDAARGIVFAIEKYDVMRGDVYLVGDESGNLRKIEIAKMILANLPECRLVEVDVKDLEERDYGYSFKKIKALGYRTTLTIEDGIREIMAVLPAIRKEDAENWKNYDEL